MFVTFQSSLFVTMFSGLTLIPKEYFVMENSFITVHIILTEVTYIVSLKN